jgi:hypothetical protein
MEMEEAEGKEEIGRGKKGHLGEIPYIRSEEKFNNRYKR